MKLSSMAVSEPRRSRVDENHLTEISFLARCLLFGFLLTFAASATAQTNTNAPVPSSVLVLTNISQIWDVSGGAAQKPQRIVTEAVVYYFDPEWSCAFGESHGRRTFLPISDCPLPLKPGDRIAIDGLVLPSKQSFLWNQTRVQLLATNALPPPTEFSETSTPRSNYGQLTSLQALVERMTFPTPTHLRLDVLCGTTPFIVFVLVGTNTPLPFTEGSFVRFKGVFTARFDSDNNLAESTLWVAQLADVEPTGSLQTDSRFALPLTPIEDIFDLQESKLIRVAGTVRSHEPRKQLTLWDETGQITVQSPQVHPLQFGDQVEAVGFPYVAGVELRLRNAFYRVVERAPPVNTTNSATSKPLRLAAQVQYLSASEAKRNPQVRLRGVLTWSHPTTPFVYVQDSSGGIRVVNPLRESTNLVPGAIVVVNGTAAPGEYVPVITNATIRRLGWRGFDAPQAVTLEQTLSGMDDGSWVEMRGFVRAMRQQRGLMHLDLTTSEGEFAAWTPISTALDSLSNSIVRITGVCSAVANEQRQLTGVELWVPNQLLIRSDHLQPTNLFDADFRPLPNLRRFSPPSELNQRIKTIGTVVLHEPGRYLYLQEDRDAVFALSRQEQPLNPGDRVEVVGYAGRHRGRFVLREAVFRRLEGGTEPPPIQFIAQGVNPTWDGLLVQTEGTLLNMLEKERQLTLLIRSSTPRPAGGSFTYDARLETTSSKLRDVPLGSRLALTGVYQVQSDEYERPATFALLLRSADDVRVLARPSWWTLPRLLALLAIVITVSLAAIAWSIFISRKNLLLRQAQSQLQFANQELESFSYSVSHDLRAPLRKIDGFSRAVLEDYSEKLDDEGKENLNIIRSSTQRMGQLIDDLLTLSKVTRAGICHHPVDLSGMVKAIADRLQREDPDRCANGVQFAIEPDLTAWADPNLMTVVMENLLSNAWKFTGKTAGARIEFGRTTHYGQPAFFVRDNGAGFEMEYAGKLFGPFQRLHTESEFPGTGIGLATVQRIIQRHGGNVWAEGKLNQGATFYFTIPSDRKADEKQSNPPR